MIMFRLREEMNALQERGIEIMDKQQIRWLVFPKIRNAVIDFSVSSLNIFVEIIASSSINVWARAGSQNYVHLTKMAV